MKNFHCAGCGLMVFFENDHCVKCGRKLGFLPDSMTIEALEERPNNLWARLGSTGEAQRYRSCENEKQHQVCNWMVSAEDQSGFCVGCRLNEVIPDLSAAGNLERWQKIERAKKRCLYTLKGLGLPTWEAAPENRPALQFRFLADIATDSNVTTGHEAGVITLNIAEADDDKREQRRIRLQEPFRTLVGHFRHELGHYYWDRLIVNSAHHGRFRERFGDEAIDYEASLQNYYRQGPAADWPQRTVTAYASAHPWEDWAETWAHYLHIYDTLETADSFNLAITSSSPIRSVETATFDEILGRWVPLSCALNAINRGMGLLDLYPFVIPDTAAAKLRFIHDLILPYRMASRRDRYSMGTAPTAARAASKDSTLTGLMR
jgi:hypothetical protein